MSAVYHGITTNTIRWDKEQTDVNQDERAFVDISVEGMVADQDIVRALLLLPRELPITQSGPVGNSTELRGATLQTRQARYGEGGIILTANYRKTLASIVSGPGGGSEEQRANADKVGLRIAVEEAPILTHPTALKFGINDKNLLSGLLNGYVRSNVDIGTETGSSTVANEFVRKNADGDWSEPVKFSTQRYSASFGGSNVTMSPLECARMIKAGVTTFKVATQSLTWTGSRGSSVSTAELNSVGTVVKPPVAPNVSNRDWFYEGLSQQQITDNTYEFAREYQLSGPGGYLKQLYPRGSGDINTNS